MNRADVRELECLVAVADHLSFSRAAKQLHLSQPPLTRHIQSLEAKLGARLLERNTHAVSVTPAGKLFLEDARAILSHLDRAGETLRRAQAGETARLRLAFIGALLDERLVRLLRRFRDLHPECQVAVTDLSPAAQLAALRAGELDGGFIGARPAREAKEIGFTVWSREPLLLALPENHPLAAARALRWEALRGLGWVMVSRQAAPAFRQQFSEIETRHALAARIVQESDRLPAVLTMVAAGSGVAMVPQSASHLLSAGIAFRALPPPRPFLDHTFAHAAKNPPEMLVRFLKLLKQGEK